MNHMNVKTKDATLVTEVSSKGDGKLTWAVLRVWHWPTVSERHRGWLAEVASYSSVYHPKKRRLASGSLERALKLFTLMDMSEAVKEMGRIAREQALEYAETNGFPVNRSVLPSIPADEDRLLPWLYQVEAEELSLRRVARDLGADEGTIRAALKSGRPIKVALRQVLPFMDRAGFAAKMGERDAQG